jgi:hypothetical protein
MKNIENSRFSTGRDKNGGERTRDCPHYPQYSHGILGIKGGRLKE